MALTHSHWCKRCDTTWSCTDDPCLWYFVDARYEVRKHGCPEQLAYSKKMGRLLRNAGTPCIYGCTKPCAHPKGKEAA